MDGVVLVDGFRYKMTRLDGDVGVHVMSNEGIRLISRAGKNGIDMMRHTVVRDVGTETCVDAEEDGRIETKRDDRLCVLGAPSTLLTAHVSLGSLGKARRRGSFGDRGGIVRLLECVSEHGPFRVIDLPTRPTCSDGTVHFAWYPACTKQMSVMHVIVQRRHRNVSRQLKLFGIEFVEKGGVIIIPGWSVGTVLSHDAHWLLFALSSIGENAAEHLNNRFGNFSRMRKRVNETLVMQRHDGDQVHFIDVRGDNAVAAIIFDSVATIPVTVPIPTRATLHV